MYFIIFFIYYYLFNIINITYIMFYGCFHINITLYYVLLGSEKPNLT